MEAINNKQYDKVIFAITSYNLTNCKYSPVDIVFRTLLIRGLMSNLKDREMEFTIVKIPHFSQRDGYASQIVKYISYEMGVDVNNSNTDVLTLGKFLAGEFVDSGYTTLFHPSVDHVQLFDAFFNKRDEEYFYQNIGESARYIFKNMPEVLKHIEDIWTDPILTDTGGLSDTRNYHTYAYNMSNESMIEVKFNDIKSYICEGKIVDDGCADAALFVPIAREFPDSDLLGIDISDEFIARANERIRAGFYGKNFIKIIQGNITKPLFKKDSIDTVICNSTIHEIWSYNNKRESVLAYLKLKYDQITNGGRIVIRDVIGPVDKDKVVCVADLEDSKKLEKFLSDFAHRYPDDYFGRFKINGNEVYKMTMKLASEYLLHKDYTENWQSEMKEEFCHFNKEDWVNLLIEIGFKVVVVDTYTSEWIHSNRYKNKILLTDENGLAINFPDTNCVVVGEK